MKYFDKEVFNDLELLDVIGDGDGAIEIFIKKYKPLILKYIRYFCLTEVEDMLQEGYLLLYQALRTYRRNSNNSFTRYFEVVVKRGFKRIKDKQKEKEYILSETIEAPVKCYLYELHTINLSNYTLMEKEVLNSYIQKGALTKDIEEKYGAKAAYNALYRAKSKIRDGES